MKRKSALRRTIVARRDDLPAQEVRRRSAAAGSHLSRLSEFASARCVMFFVSFGSEVDTLPMIQKAVAGGKRVAAPRADPRTRSLLPCEILDPEKDLAPGAHKIREPRPHCPEVPLAEIDAIVVPAAVWGEDGYRVGYGGGYYDRFLARLKDVRRIGLGLETQVIPEVPHGPHDLPVEVLVTDAGIRRFGRQHIEKE